MEGRECARTDIVAGRMSAPHAPRALCAYACAVLVVLITACAASPSEDTHPTKREDAVPTKKIELLDGVTVKIPQDTNSTKKLVSFEIDTNGSVDTGRGKQKKLMQRILPMFIMPFLIQSTIVPLFLSMLKFMLFKSLMVGKLALALILFNAFKNHNASKGRHDAEIADVHYGYHENGMEYGAYMN